MGIHTDLHMAAHLLKKARPNGSEEFPLGSSSFCILQITGLHLACLCWKRYSCQQCMCVLLRPPMAQCVLMRCNTISQSLTVAEVKRSGLCKIHVLQFVTFKFSSALNAVRIKIQSQNDLWLIADSSSDFKVWGFFPPENMHFCHTEINAIVPLNRCSREIKAQMRWRYQLTAEESVYFCRLISEKGGEVQFNR